MPPTTSTLAQLWAKADRPGVRAFFLSITALGVALLLALYSGAAAELGNVGVAASSALFALAIAAWVAVTLVPTLAKRTPLRWIGHKVEYKITRAGWLYFGATLLVALAALNTGNNLLFLILACLVSIILVSGILSSISLAGIDLKIGLPEHIFAGQTVRASVELVNGKLTLPSFALLAGCSFARNAGIFSVHSPPAGRQAEPSCHFSETRIARPGHFSHRHTFPFWIPAKDPSHRSEIRSARLSQRRIEFRAE